MFLTFILGVLAGWGAPMAEEALRRPLQQALSGELSPIELRGMTLVLCLFAASILALMLGSAAALPLVLGALVGVLGPRLYSRFRAMQAPDYDS